MKVQKYNYEMVNPDIVSSIDQIDSALVVEPVYRLTKGLTQKKMRQIVKEALNIASNLFDELGENDTIPFRQALQWPTFAEALYAAHNPKNDADVGPNSIARKRMAFEEMRVQQSQLALTRWYFKTRHLPLQQLKHQKYKATAFKSWQDSPLVSLAITTLPFSLTNSQINCLTEAWNDSLSCSASFSNARMERILQGDTGSGKTIVGYLLSLGCFEARVGGANVAAFLAPTTLLAEQHAQTLAKMTLKLNDSLSIHDNNMCNVKRIRVDLLTGYVNEKKREEILSRIENCPDDEAFFLVGTHALLTPEIACRLQKLNRPSNMGFGLCMSIIDEEQRFGVSQRECLALSSAHALYMSATPIPRTIALGGSSANIIVGSLDVSSLNEKPIGAREVKTSIIDISRVQEIILGVQRQIALGAKVFWIMPTIGDDDEESWKSATEDVGEVKEDSTRYSSTAIDRHSDLQHILGAHRVGLVHGRMSHQEREKQIEKFKDPQSGMDVIVGTTVLEVGVDIPSVTILVVESADRFGLSQLHQLRGRVGRVISTNWEMVENTSRNLDCHCVLLTTKQQSIPNEKSLSMRRLQVLKDTDDGEQIALADFTMRGPGELLGRRQSGFRSGYSIVACSHWGMIAAASKLGRSFLETKRIASSNKGITEEQKGTAKSSFSKQIEGFGCSREGFIIESCFENAAHRTDINNASAASMSGLTLRAYLALFGHWKPSSEQHQSTGYYFSLLSGALESLGQPSDFDKVVERKFLSLAEGLGDIKETSEYKDSTSVEESRKWKELSVSVSTKGIPANASFVKSQDQLKEMNGITEERVGKRIAPVAKSGLNNVAESRSTDFLKVIHNSNFQRINLQNDEDVAILLLDVETTGLNPGAHYITQVAAKILGSDDIFCEYALPPVSIPRHIEKLTGITQDFLSHGGTDSFTGITRKGPAKDFRSVYSLFCEFCQKIGDKRHICLVAHNAAFDIRFMNAEIKRLALANSLDAQKEDHSSRTPPMLSLDTGIITTVDTLKLFKSSNFWPSSLSKPASYALKDLYEAATSKKLESAHNAVADILALEDILLSPHFKSHWRKMASEIQIPLFFPKDVN